MSNVQEMRRSVEIDDRLPLTSSVKEMGSPLTFDVQCSRDAAFCCNRSLTFAIQSPGEEDPGHELRDGASVDC